MNHYSAHPKVTDELKYLLTNPPPDLDINVLIPRYFYTYIANYEETFLASALRYGNIELAQLLMKCPGIDVNKENTMRRSPLYMLCSEIQNHSSIALLLDDPRTVVDWTMGSRNNPFWAAWFYNNLEIVEMILSHPMHTVDLVYNKGLLSEEVRKRGKDYAKIASLICEFEVDYEGAKKRLIRKRGPDKDSSQSAQLFLMVRLSEEGFFTIKKDFHWHARRIDGNIKISFTQSSNPEEKEQDLTSFGETLIAVKLFGILKKLPVELQMLLCNRCYGLSEKFIKSELILLELRVFVW